MGNDKRGGSVKVFRPLALEGACPDNINSCFYIKGQNLRMLFDALVSEICKREQIAKYELSHEITVQIGSEKSTIPKYFSQKDYFPIYLFNILLTKLPAWKQEKYRSILQREIKSFKFGASKTWARFPKRLSKELSWLAGAVAADGWITKAPNGKERLGVVDQNVDALKLVQENFMKGFGIKPSLKRSKKRDCWILILDCKAVSRFFTTFLGFGYGCKAKTIAEPQIIKNSHYRLDFAKGVMLFDGSVELDSTVSIGVRSRKLIDDLYEIFSENNFEFKFSRVNSETWCIRSPYLSKCLQNKKWRSLFSINTTKWNRLNFLINGSGQAPSSEQDALKKLEHFIRKKPTSKISITEIFNFAKNKKRFTKHHLMNEYGLSHATFWKYLLVLRKSNIVKSEENRGRYKPNYYTFNSNIGEWRVPFTVS